MPLFGVDTSGAAVDWPRVYAAGIRFGIVKATEGNGLTLNTLPANLKGMRALGNGFVPGVYHFLISGQYVSGADQCDYFLSKVGDVSDLIVALDVEKEGNLAYQAGITEVQDFIKRFSVRVPNHPIVIYSGAWYWGSRTYMGNPSGAQLTPYLWDSKYVTDPKYASPTVIYGSVPSSFWTPGYGGWAKTTLLQFTAWPTIPGVSGASDASAFQGTVDQLRSLLITGQSLPDTSTTGDALVLLVKDNFTANAPVSILAGASVTGYYFSTATNSMHVKVGPLNFASGSSCHASARWTLDGTSYLYIVDGGFAGSVIPEGDHVVLGSIPAPDCAAQVKAATDPLNTQIATLQSQVTSLNTRLAGVKSKVATLNADVAND